jgi:hypothetical protein
VPQVVTDENYQIATSLIVSSIVVCYYKAAVTLRKGKPYILFNNKSKLIAVVLSARKVERSARKFVDEATNLLEQANV